MAQHTKQPQLLRELFRALADDPFVIAECLARPVLAQRLLMQLNNEDESCVVTNNIAIAAGRDASAGAGQGSGD